MSTNTQCTKCLGTGKTYDTFQMDYLTCSRCGGSCYACLGAGTVVTARGVERCGLCGGTGRGR